MNHELESKGVGASLQESAGDIEGQSENVVYGSVEGEFAFGNR
ncbi:MAG: hypothetical protein ACJ746_22665 [Bryobacteraceae bacterium]